MSKYQRKNRTQKRRVFFENLEERSMVSSSVLGVILGAFFVPENHENKTVRINDDVLSGTINGINNTHSVQRFLQKSHNALSTNNLFSADFLFDEDELSTIARSSGTYHSSGGSAIDAVFGNEVFGNDEYSFWNFLSNETQDLTRKFSNDLLLNQTLQTKQAISTTKNTHHFSALSSLPTDNTITSSNAGITVTSGIAGSTTVTTTPLVSETLQFTASPQTTLANNFTENDTQIYSEASYGDVYFCYAAVAGALAENWTTPNVAPNVLVDTGYVFQTGNTASVVAEIWGEPVWEYVPWSVEILDPGTYWNYTYFSGTEFYLPDSVYIEKDFTWTKPTGLANNDSSIDRDFTFRFTVDDLDPVDLNVHIAWAEVQVQFAGEGGFKHTSVTDTQSTDNTVVVGQKVEAKLEHDQTVTLLSEAWATPTGGSYVKDYVTDDSEGTVVSHTSSDYTADTFEFYYISASNVGQISVTSVFTDPNGSSYGINRNASYYLEKPTVVTLTATQTSTRLRVDNWGHYMELSSVSASGITTPGMIFNASVTTSAINGSGEVNFLQTLIEQSDRTGTGGLPPQEMSSHGDSVLDSEFPYGNPTPGSSQTWSISAGQTLNSNSSPPLTTIDSPKQPFDNINPTTTNYTTYSINDPFTMYLIYKPDGVGSIWVPLIAISWNWTATAQWNLDTSDNTYKWMITSDTSNTETNGHAVNALPQWTQNVETITTQWTNKQ